MASRKLIVIDDEQSVCELIKKLFEGGDYDVTGFNDPEEGLKGVAEQNPDCVLLDIKMPKVGGVEVLSKIKEHNPQQRVIMITGYGDLESAMESMKLGAYDYITKPFDLEFIRAVVDKCISGGK